MDGVLLVLDTRNLPNLHALATVPEVPSKAQPKRNRAVPAFATLILAIVLGLVYYVSIHRRAAQNVYTPPIAASAPESAPVLNPTPESQPSQEVQVAAPSEVKAQPVKQPVATTPAKKQPAKVAPVTQRKTESEPKKEDSKVGSILKKTGHILKKPFKF
jgi:hypothetical protein